MSEVQYKELGGHLFPYNEDLSSLAKPVEIKGDGTILKNALVIQPLEGADCKLNGAPSEITYRRYKRMCETGAGLIWFESLALTEDGRSYPTAAWINEDNLEEYKQFINWMKTEYPGVTVIAQLTHAGRFAKPHEKATPEAVISTWNPHHAGRVALPDDHHLQTDEELDVIGQSFIDGARLCKEAGFDGVDIKACHGYLFSDLLTAVNRPGRNGGSFENRTSLLLNAIKTVKEENDDFILACRICYADNIPYPFGFGMKKDGSLDTDPTETLQLVKVLKEAGVSLINVSVNRVTVNKDYIDFNPALIPHDTNEDMFNRFYEGVKHLKSEFPEVTFVATGFTVLKKDSAPVAAGMLDSGAADLVGFGRMSLACPEYLKAAVSGESIEGFKTCTVCGNCHKLLRSGTPAGCATRDQEVYLPLLRELLGK